MPAVEFGACHISPGSQSTLRRLRQGLMADTVRQMSIAASPVALPRSEIMGRIRPFAAAPDNASEKGLRVHRADSGLGIT